MSNNLRNILFLAVALSAGIAVAWWVESPSTDSASNDAKQAADPVEVFEDGINTPFVEMAKPIQELVKKTSDEQEAYSLELLENPNISDKEQEKLMELLFDKSLSPLTKNNFAGALLSQPKPSQRLSGIFINIIDDKTQDPVWRDYAIQFLSETLRFAEDKERIRKKLASLAEKNTTTDLQGTAIIQMAINEDEGHVELNEEFSAQTTKALKSYNTSLGTKMTLIGVIGHRGDTSNLPLVREYASQTDNDALKRVAIATLGQIGQKQDITLIREALTHSNKSVQMAAKGAIKRFKSRQLIPLGS